MTKATSRTFRSGAIALGECIVHLLQPLPKHKPKPQNQTHASLEHSELGGDQRTLLCRSNTSSVGTSVSCARKPYGSLRQRTRHGESKVRPTDREKHAVFVGPHGPTPTVRRVPRGRRAAAAARRCVATAAAGWRTSRSRSAPAALQGKMRARVSDFSTRQLDDDLPRKSSKSKPVARLACTSTVD